MGLNGKSAADRDGAKDIYPYGCLFRVQLAQINSDSNIPAPLEEEDWVTACHIFVKDKSSVAKQYSIAFKGLIKSRWAFKLEPVIRDDYDFSDITDVLKLGVNGGSKVFINLPSLAAFAHPLAIEGAGIVGEFEGTLAQPAIEMGEIADTVREYYDRRFTSSDQGAPIVITTVSEIIDPTLENLVSNYPEIAVLGVKIRASEVISSTPDLGIFVAEGREVMSPLVFGYHFGDDNSQAATNPLYNFTLEGVIPGYMLWNLDSNLLTPITQVLTSSVSGSNSLFNKGDRFLVYKTSFSNYFPDIYLDLLINPKGGLGSIVDPRAAVDYDSIIKARNFCIANNYFWDGVIDSLENFSEWVSTQAAFSRLLPIIIAGRYGLAIEKEGELPKAIFNGYNIIKNSYQEEVLPWQQTNINQVALTFTDGSDYLRPVRGIVCQTLEASQGVDKIDSLSVDAPSITRLEQAKDVAALILKSKRLQNKAVKFSTATQGLFLSPADLIIVQHQATEYEFELSGYISELFPFNTATYVQKFKLSRTPSLDITNDYFVSILCQSTDTVLRELPFSIVTEADDTYIEVTTDNALPIFLENPLLLGDPVIIGKNVIQDRVYRVQSIDRDGDGVISITALVRDEDIFDDSDLVFSNV